MTQSLFSAFFVFFLFGPLEANSGIRSTTPYVVKRRNRDMLDFCALLYVRRRYVPAHTQPRAQLVDVKCVVPPAPEHSQTALLTSESNGGTCHCPAEVLVRVWHIHPSHLDDAARREPRSVEVEFVDFDDDKIHQKRKDNY